MSQESGTYPVARMYMEYNYNCSYSYRTEELASPEFDPQVDTVFISEFTTWSQRGKYTLHHAT